ncbi:MAG: type IX secretion system membrane protein PorP/SprF, partial [Bacteroidota bacterium]
EKLWLGASWRPNNAMVFIVEYYLTRMLRLGYAYDYPTTQLQTYGGASHEFMLGIDLGFSKTKMVSPRLF